MRTNIEVVQEILSGATQREVVSAAVADDANYVSLTYENPELQAEREIKLTVRVGTAKWITTLIPRQQLRRAIDIGETPRNRN
jgi:hypothetical protein